MIHSEPARVYSGPNAWQRLVEKSGRFVVYGVIAGVVWFVGAELKAYFETKVEHEQRVERVDKIMAAAVFDECADLLLHRFPDRAASNGDWQVPLEVAGPAIRALSPSMVVLSSGEVCLWFANGFGDTKFIRYVVEPSSPNHEDDELRRQVGSIEQVIYTGRMKMVN